MSLKEYEGRDVAFSLLSFLPPSRESAFGVRGSSSKGREGYPEAKHREGFARRQQHERIEKTHENKELRTSYCGLISIFSANTFSFRYKIFPQVTRQFGRKKGTQAYKNV